MSLQTNKTLVVDIFPILSSALNDLQLGKIFLLFSQARNQKINVASWHRRYYTILNKILGLGFINTIFHYIRFFLFINRHTNLHLQVYTSTPDIAITVSFLDIVIVQYFSQRMGENIPPKMQNESVIASFCQEISPMVSCPFCDK